MPVTTSKRPHDEGHAHHRPGLPRFTIPDLVASTPDAPGDELGSLDENDLRAVACRMLHSSFHGPLPADLLLPLLLPRPVIPYDLARHLSGMLEVGSVDLRPWVASLDARLLLCSSKVCIQQSVYPAHLLRRMALAGRVGHIQQVVLVCLEPDMLEVFNAIDGLDSSDIALCTWHMEDLQAEISRLRGKVTEWSFWRRTHVSPEDVAAVGMKHLKEFNLGGCSFDPAAAAALHRAPEVQTVTMIRGEDVGAVEVALFASFPKLASLNLNGSCPDDDALDALRGAPQLLKLELEQSGIASRGMVAVGAMRSLKQLVLSGCSEATDDDLARIAGCSLLDTINLQSTKAGPATVAALGGCTQLKTLILAHCEAAIDVSMASLGRLTVLQALDLTGTPIAEVGAAALCQMRCLSVVLLNNCAALEDKHFASWTPDCDNPPHHPHLKKVMLANTAAGAAAIRGVCAAPRLAELILSGCSGVDDDAAATLGSATELRLVDLENSKVSSQGIKALCGLPHLQVIDLTGCSSAPAEAFLPLLSATSPSLHTISLHGTDAPLEVFQHALALSRR